MDEGWVHWNTASLSDRQNQTFDHSLARYTISFPHVRWGAIRATEGWAGLQHHVLLHTKITLLPPSSFNPLVDKRPSYLLLSASQCSHLALLVPSANSVVPHWNTGNIYAYNDAPAIRIPLNNTIFSSEQSDTLSSERLFDGTTLNSNRNIELDLLMSLDYEIRLFGDPTVFKNDTIPTIQAELQAAIELENSYDPAEEPTKQQPASLGHEQGSLSMSDTEPARSIPHILISKPGSHIVPHFVGGWAYGDVIGIEVTSYSPYYLTIDQVTAKLAGDSPLTVCPTPYRTRITRGADTTVLLI